MKLFFLALFTSLIFVSMSSAGDSFTMTKDGKTYLCEEIDDGGGSCWERCPYTFSSCADSCGGGSECWNKCPYTFSNCADSCGGGSSCWDQCPYTFSSCSESCGAKNKDVDPEIFMRFMLTHEERLEEERKDFN